jgi:hypothetical protein
MPIMKPVSSRDSSSEILFSRNDSDLEIIVLISKNPAACVNKDLGYDHTARRPDPQ